MLRSKLGKVAGFQGFGSSDGKINKDAELRPPTSEPYYKQMNYDRSTPILVAIFCVLLVVSLFVYLFMNFM